MPKGTKVERCYEEVKKQGHSEASAARICQSSTGQSLKTGKPSKHGKNLKALRKMIRKKDLKRNVVGYESDPAHARVGNLRPLPGHNQSTEEMPSDESPSPKSRYPKPQILPNYGFDPSHYLRSGSEIRPENPEPTVNLGPKPKMITRVKVLNPKIGCSKILRGKCSCNTCSGH